MLNTIDENIFNSLPSTAVFTRRDVYEILKKAKGNISEALANYTLQQYLKDGKIIRVGRNKYCVADGSQRQYEYSYSETAINAAMEIRKNHPDLNFRIFELTQLNEFVNHLIAHNVVFVSVESDLGNFVFSTLKKLYPGNVLIYPDAETYHNYAGDNTVVIERLISEAPAGTVETWHSRPEKILVDLLADKCIAEAVNEGELVNIFRGFFSTYAIDEDTMFRYARRRNAEEKVRNFIIAANIILRTV